jgi:hypothetical protein
MLLPVCRIPLLLVFILLAACAPQQGGGSGAQPGQEKNGAPATEVSEAGARALAKELRSSLERLNIDLQHYATFENVSLKGLDLRPQGDAYALSVTQLELRSETVNPIGIILDRAEFLLEPLGGDSYRITLVSAATKPRLRDYETGLRSSLRTEGLHFSAVISTRYDIALQHEFSIDKVIFKTPSGDISFGPYRYVMTSEQISPGVVDVVESFNNQDFNMSIGGELDLSFKRIRSSGQYRLDLDRRAAALDALQAQGITSGVYSFQAVGQLLPAKADERYLLEGLSFGGEANRALVEEAALDLVIEKKGPDRLDLQTELRIDGVSYESLGGDASKRRAALLPTSLTLRLTASDLPYREAFLYLDELEELPDAEVLTDGGDDVAEILLEKLGRTVTASGMTLALHEAKILTSTSGLAATGQLTAGSGDALGWSGEIETRVTGFSDIRRGIASLAADEDSEAGDLWQSLLTLLGLMTVYADGPDAPAPASGDELSFDIKLRPQGDLRVNGLPVDF